MKQFYSDHSTSEGHLVAFKSFDFQMLTEADVEETLKVDETPNVDETSNVDKFDVGDVFVNLDLEVGRIRHSWPNVDRCCVAPKDEFDIQRFDDIEKISCKIDKDEFFRTFVENRKAVILLGCQDGWKAKNWTVEGNRKKERNKERKKEM
jgi:hypothetical protein